MKREIFAHKFLQFSILRFFFDENFLKLGSN